MGIAVEKDKQPIKQLGRSVSARGGYSLIETLMVVLIVGILTAVALPQYQRAVTKAEYTRSRSIATTLARGMDAYYATYKKYTPVMGNLDVTIDYSSSTADCSDESSSCSYSSNKRWGYVPWSKTDMYIVARRKIMCVITCFWKIIPMPRGPEKLLVCRERTEPLHPPTIGLINFANRKRVP